MHLLPLLATPAGILAICLALLIQFLIIKMRWGKWAALIVFSNVAVLSFSLEELTTGNHRQFVFPISLLRNFSRPISVALLVMLLPSAIAAARGHRRRLFLPAAGAFLAFQLIVAIRLFVTGTESARAILDSSVSILQFAVLGYGLNLWIQSLKDVKTCIRSIAMMNALFVIASLQQLAVSPSLVMENGRFIGVTPNAQFASVLLSSTIPAYYYLLLDKSENIKLRILWGLFAGLAIVFLLGTGSRTGTLMLVVGTLLFFRLRLAKFLVVVPVVGLFIAVIWRYTHDVTGASSRLLDTTNTRERIWSIMWTEFMDAPIFGSGSSVTPENSYLATAANTGVLGLIPLCVFLALLLHAAIKVSFARAHLGALREVPNLVLAGIGSLLIGAVFEAFLLGTLNFALVVLFAYMALLAAALDASEHRPIEQPII
ncbi:MAG: O-antigen ligase family protein [Phycisphaerales bacterium JB063]